VLINQVPCFDINRREGAEGRGQEVQHYEKLREIREKKKKEEKNKAKALPNCDLIVLCSFFGLHLVSVCL